MKRRVKIISGYKRYLLYLPLKRQGIDKEIEGRVDCTTSLNYDGIRDKDSYSHCLWYIA